MKTSRYNFFVEWNDLNYGVNLMSGAQILLSSSQHQTLECGDSSNKLEPEVLDRLIKGKFLVNEDLDEFEVLKVEHRASVFENEKYRMTIMPTQNCNLNCWYCYESHDHSTMSLELKSSIISFVRRIIDEGKIKCFELDWFGGEPMIYFNEVVYPLSKEIKAMVQSAGITFINSITTNGVLIGESMLPQFKEISLNSFQITVDGNRHYHNKSRIGRDRVPTYDTIISNINNLSRYSEDTKICVRVNYTNKTLSDIFEMVDDVDKFKNISFFFQRIWQNDDDPEQVSDLLSQVRDYIKDRNNTYEDRYYEFRKRCKCYADRYNQVVINYNGDLFKCTARNFADKSTVLGHLNSDGICNWNNKFYNRFNTIALDNGVCKQCVLAPVCLGACSQRFLDNNKFYEKCDPKGMLEALKEQLYGNLYEFIKQNILQ